ncbi:cell division cycle-associated protein 4-like [Saccoglossus kowalevskii]|uniref:Cell division cycle-associated protein 4-like n=1 Tax=Saccoglossus kowalevskii TaxID=10224 RepID=A0ABM0GQN5_SACKO|nr:PREDICTED: cell division cycle-associated protein 4-like [Saccoglossus kowalevskii]
MLAKGIKRKYHDLEEEPKKGVANMYCEQRQSFLNISLVKLRTCHNVTEPCLLRSVLICNTLKQIENEIATENHRRQPCDNVGVEKKLSRPCVVSSEENERCKSVAGMTTLEVAMETEEGAQVICGTGDQIEGRTLQNRVACNEIKKHCTTDISMSLLEACEEEFSDIDVSLYDFDLFMPLSPKSTEDVWKPFCFEKSIADSLSSPCRTDVADELDQIMNTLIEVGM